MNELNYPWPYERMTQPSLEGIVETLQTQLARVSWAIGDHVCQSNQNAYYQNQADYAPNYYHPGWQNYPSFSWNNNQDQCYDPNLSYHSDYGYQPPPYHEDTSKLEDILSKILEQQEERRMEGLITQYISQTGDRLANLQASMQSIMNHVANTYIIHPQSTLPSDTELDPIDEGEEQCMVDEQGSGEELHEVVRETFESVHPILDVDSEVDEMRSMNGDYEKEIEDQEVTFEVFKPIEHPLVHEEYPHVDLDKSAIMDKADEESFFLPMDEVKFEGRQSCMHVMHYKEKTARRHDMVIFAIEPD